MYIQHINTQHKSNISPIEQPPTSIPSYFSGLPRLGDESCVTYI